MRTDTTGHVSMTIERFGDQIVIEFDTGETLILNRHHALTFAATLKYTATRGTDLLDHIHADLAP